MNYSALPPLPPSEGGVEYRHIPRFFGYVAGDDGSIWSCLRPNKKRRTFASEWHLKKKWMNQDGYYIVSLWGDDGNDHRLLAHTAILLAFVGPRPRGYDALHANGDPSDNRLENLRWGTRKENMDDARKHGTLARGERNGHAKMNALKVAAAKQLRLLGWNQRDVAAVCGVSQCTISAIDNRKRWQDV